MGTPVRWRTTNDDDRQPALFDTDAFVERHIGKGEFRGLEFLHVNAKRIINEVPEVSQVPFRFTINAYRGCSHACAYCGAGDTLVVMADGTTRELGGLRRGDTVLGGNGRPTPVLDHRETRKPAYELRVDNGARLVASPDHLLRGEHAWMRVDELERANVFCAELVRSGRTNSAQKQLRRVTRVEPLGIEMPMYDITTGTGDFIANGVVSHNCFARPTHDYLGLNVGSDFDSKIVVKVNAVERLRAELAPKRWGGHHIAMGTNTDPYQRAEGKYHLTRGVIEELTRAANPFSILTKSTLILRDLDLLVAARKKAEVHAAFSIGTLDEDVWKLTEPGTPHPRQRVAAVAKLNAAGIPCGVLIAPILPGLSDRPDQIEAVKRACKEAGAANVSTIKLHLRKGVRDHFMTWLAGARPDLVPLYERLYRGRAYLPANGARTAKPTGHLPSR